MKSDKLNKLEQDPPPINGAYIRSLVKQLTTKNRSSKSNDTTTGNVVAADNSSVSESSRNNLKEDNNKVVGSEVSQQQQKKQVRRRLHTARPYRDRPLNMAEARREIAAALKFHRATKNQHQQISEQDTISSFEHDGKFYSLRNSNTLPPLPLPSSSSYMNNFPSNNNMIDEFSYSPILSSIPLPSFPNSFQNFPFLASSYSSLPIDPPLLPENPNFTSLSNQSLGLNSNFDFHNFNNLDGTLFLNNNNNINSLSPSNYSPPISDLKVPSIIETTKTLDGEGVSFSSMVDNNNNNYYYNNNNTIGSVGGGDRGLPMHITMDDEGIKEIESLCEQYQMEWNDTINFITSTWWFNFLNDNENDETEIKTQSDAHQVFDEVTEFPTLLSNNANESCSEDYFKDSTLPCMDIIGDIEFEGTDAEWLS